MAVAKLLAHDRGVLAFRQGIVIAVAGARFGELDAQLLQQLRDPLVDVFRAVVGVEAAQDEGESLEHLLQGRDEEPFTDLFHRTDHLALGDFVDGVDVVDALVLVPIALMDRVDADIARFALGPGLASFSDGRGRGAGLLDVMALPGVGGGLAQVVQVAHGDPGQCPVFGLPKDRTGALTELLDGRPAGRLMALIHRRQQADILIAVAADKPGNGALAAPQLAGVAVLSNQSGQLLARVAADSHQIAHHHPLIGSAEPQVVESDQLSLDPAVAVVLVTADRKSHRLSAGQEIPQLGDRLEFVEFHDGCHPPS